MNLPGGRTGRSFFSKPPGCAFAVRAAVVMCCRRTPAWTGVFKPGYSGRDARAVVFTPGRSCGALGPWCSRWAVPAGRSPLRWAVHAGARRRGACAGPFTLGLPPGRSRSLFCPRRCGSRPPPSVQYPFQAHRLLPRRAGQAPAALSPQVGVHRIGVPQLLPQFPVAPGVQPLSGQCPLP